MSWTTYPKCSMNCASLAMSRGVGSAGGPSTRTCPSRKGTLTRTGRISLALRESVPWLLSEPQTGENGLLGAQGEVLAHLSRAGASFMQDIISATGSSARPDVEDALWKLAAAGLVTSDGFTAVRGMIDGTAKKQPRRAPTYGRSLRRRVPSSRWSLLEGETGRADVVEARAWQLLRRYGVVFPELLVRETNAPRWRDLVRVCRRAEGSRRDSAEDGSSPTSWARTVRHP